jgi:hypothetical protein
VDDLRTLEARVILGDIPPTDLHSIADALLADGLMSQSLVDLFALGDLELPWRGPGLFHSATRELGSPEIAPDVAWRHLALSIANEILTGTVSPEIGAKHLARLYHATHCQHDVLLEMLSLDDELPVSHLGRSKAVMEANVRAEARRLVGLLV